MKHFKIVLLFIFTCWLTSNLQAQYAATRLYTSADGLPATEVHNIGILPNEDGKLVIAFSALGVYTYDGETFEPYLDTLLSDFNRFKIDKKGRQWISQNSDWVCIDQGKVLQWKTGIGNEKVPLKDTVFAGEKLIPGGIITHTGTDKVLYSSKRRDAIIHSYEFNDSLSAFIRLESYPKLTVEEKLSYFLQQYPEVTQYLNEDQLKTELEYLHWYSPNSQVYHLSTIFFALPRKQPKFIVAIGGGKEIRPIEVPTHLLPKKSIDHVAHNHSTLDGHTLYLANADSTYYLYDFTPDLALHKLTRFKCSSKIIGIVKDKYNNYWGATHEGLLQIFPQFTHFTTEDNPKMLNSIHSVVQAKDGKLWFGSYGGGIGYIKDETIEVPFRQKINVLPGAVLDHTGTPLMITSRTRDFPYNNIIKITSDNQLLSASPIGTTGFYLARNKAEQLVMGTNGQGLMIQNKEGCPTSECWDFIDQSKGFDLGNVLTFQEDHLGRYWMMHHSKGWAVYLPDQDTVFNFTKNTPRTLTSWQDDQGQMYIGTSQGVARFFPPAVIPDSFVVNDYIEQLDTSINKNDAFITSMEAIGDQWLATTSITGFQLINQKMIAGGLPLPVIHKFGPKNGYIAEGGDQNAIWLDENSKALWFATDKGVSRFNYDLFPFDNSQPSLLIDYIKGDFQNNDGDNISVKPEENRNFTIEFHLKKSLNPFVDEYYVYQLDQKAPQAIRNTSIQLKNLPYGTHELTIMGYRNGIASSPKNLRISVIRPFYHSAWFYGILITAGIFIGIASYLFFQRRRKRQIEVSNLRIRNLIDNLSPHFLGNSFNWIRNRAKIGGDQEAAMIINKMDNIVRTVFQNNRKNRAIHSLREELSLLRDYFDIQQVRYGDRHQYLIEELDPDFPLEETFLPIMMLQIITENAIEHGLRNKPEGKGTVWVKFAELVDGVEILIEDDGVGRIKAAKMVTQSFGESTQMLTELVNELNKYNSQKFRFEYDDNIFSEDDLGYGTRCRFFIPKNYSYELKS